MLERDGYIPGVPCWIDTSQPDPEAAVDFYHQLFGWDFEDTMPPGSEGKYFVARLQGRDVAAVSSQPQNAAPPAAWNTYIWVESTDHAVSEVLKAGGRALVEPFDILEAGRMAVCTDREGAVFSLWQAKRHKGAQIVNEPGTLNFNVLNSRDADLAKSFYGAVFGWQALELGPVAFAWRLPGYGDFLEERDPGLRERMQQIGAPAGFEDAVATFNRVGDGQPDVPVHWGVTFAVDDADAVADTAAQLGAQVLMPPIDAPWVRMTVIADPQGATFTASKFVPENRDV